MLLLAIIVAAAPYAAAVVARRELAPRLSEQLGTQCRIDSIAASWLTGIELGAVEIANPPGFDASHPLLRIDGGRASVSLLQALAGKFEVTASLDAPQLFLDEDANGDTNLATVLRALDASASTTVRAERPGQAPHKAPAGTPIDADLLRRLMVDCSLRNGAIQVRRAGELVESATGIDFAIHKALTDTTGRVTLDATLPATETTTRTGAVHLALTVDALAQSATGSLHASRFDIARYLPLLRRWLAPGDLTAFAGVIDGEVQFTYDPKADPRLSTGGEVTVTDPHFSGPLLSGMDLRSARWTIQPRVALAAGTDGSDAIAPTGTHVDLGFARLDAIDVGDDGSLGALFTVDLPALRQLGGPLAAMPEVAGQLTGSLVLPRELANAKTGAAALAALRTAVVDARLVGANWSGQGFALADAGATLSLRDGKVTLASDPTTTLNSGPVEVHCTADASAEGATPFELTMRWTGGKVEGPATQLLQYAVPLLAGLGQQAGAFDSGIDLSLSLRGPAFAAAGQSVLQWLDRFEGQGDLALHDGSFAPSQAFGTLAAMLGQPQRLAIDRLAGAFTMQNGSIATRAMRWASKGREYGLAGNVKLDGTLDFGLDLTSLLQQHKDGKLIADLLGNKPLVAGLTGTLTAPRFGAPDLGKLAADALAQLPQRLLEQKGQELQQKGKDLLEQKGGDLLKQGLDQLFGPKKKKN